MPFNDKPPLLPFVTYGMVQAFLPVTGNFIFPVHINCELAFATRDYSANVFNELVHVKHYLFAFSATLSLLMKHCINLSRYRKIHIKKLIVLNRKMEKNRFYTISSHFHLQNNNF